MLDDIEKRREGGGLGPIEWSEKGRLLDRMGRYDEAFAAFSEGKRTLRELTGQAYHGGAGRGAGRGASRASSSRRG